MLCVKDKMELVYQTSDSREATDIARLLSSNGIPAFTTNEHSNDLRKYSLSNMGVFIHINSQREEALMLIANPAYKVINKVDASEMTQLKENKMSLVEANSQLLAMLLKSLGILLIIVIVVITIASNT
jgi:hypothetical protein